MQSLCPNFVFHHHHHVNLPLPNCFTMAQLALTIVTGSTRYNHYQNGVRSTFNVVRTPTFPMLMVVADKLSACEHPSANLPSYRYSASLPRIPKCEYASPRSTDLSASVSTNKCMCVFVQKNISGHVGLSERHKKGAPATKSLGRNIQ